VAVSTRKPQGGIKQPLSLIRSLPQPHARCVPVRELDATGFQDGSDRKQGAQIGRAGTALEINHRLPTKPGTPSEFPLRPSKYRAGPSGLDCSDSCLWQPQSPSRRTGAASWRGVRPAWQGQLKGGRAVAGLLPPGEENRPAEAAPPTRGGQSQLGWFA
jgi:hypothetical protein